MAGAPELKLALGPPPPDEEGEGPSAEDGQLAAARAFLAAIKSGDAEALVAAFADLKGLSSFDDEMIEE